MTKRKYFHVVENDFVGRGFRAGVNTLEVHAFLTEKTTRGEYVTGLLPESIDEDDCVLDSCDIIRLSQMFPGEFYPREEE